MTDRPHDGRMITHNTDPPSSSAAPPRFRVGLFTCLECDAGCYVHGACLACGAPAPRELAAVMQRLEKTSTAA